MPTILIIEDETELVKVLRDYLKNAGFSVETAYRGDSGLALWDRIRPDLVLLDLNLPGMDGLEVAREIRRKANTPIIMLTARVEEMDQLIGLELGADDYITKPFSPRIVVSKVRAVLRRMEANTEPRKLLRVADLLIDMDAHEVSRKDEHIDLTPTEFNLLVALAERPGRAFTRFQLLEAAQGTAYEGYERTIDAHIKNLRAKLEPDSKQPKYIETVFGVGYRFARD
jgi:two-component system alkaline phosphatase synthesis response regulator PhoP